MLRVLQLLATALLVLIGFHAKADGAISESAVAFTFNDPSLKWGPCPAFLPKDCAIAVLHGDPAKPNVDVFFKVPPGSTIPNHWHTSAERMVLVSGVLTETYDGQAPATLRSGTYSYGPAKKPHQAVCAKGAPCVLFIAFEEPLDAMPTAAPAK
jgi:quercetin dioxygenase-like cupin family protein